MAPPRTPQKPRHGSGKRPSKGTPKLKVSCRRCTMPAKACPRITEEAVAWCRKSAEQGDPQAEFNMGLMYYKGEGVLQNYETATVWFKKAAQQGHSQAQETLNFVSSGYR